MIGTIPRRFWDTPGDFTGHSLSVSDIVALRQAGVVSYHYCDSIGFQELPNFRPENYLKTAELSTEDDFEKLDLIPEFATLAFVNFSFCIAN